MIINIENLGNVIRTSHFNKEGNIEYTDVPVNVDEQFNWQKCSPRDNKRDKEFTTWDGIPVKKIPSRRYDKFRIMEILLNADPDITAPLWEFQTPNKYFVDIEVEMTDEKLDSLNTVAVKNKIVSIGIATSKKKSFVLGLEPLESSKIASIYEDINLHFQKYNETWDFQYHYFESEFDMLYTFFKSIAPKMGLITGWNWFGYDWPYLVNRAEKIGINPGIMSPSNRLIGKNRTPLHILMVDYLEIYKKWDRTIKIKESDKLDYVAEQATGIKKIEYDGSLKDLYETDKVKFMFYNAVDCILLHYIDQKLRTMATLFKIAQLNKVEIDRALSPVWATEVMMLEKFLSRKKVFVQDDSERDHVRFKGGYVKEPVKSLLGWIVGYDFASLYPNTMVQWGISPEAYKGKNIDNAPDTWTKCISGAYFDNTEEPVLKEIIKDLYSKRRKAKDRMLEIKNEIQKLEKQLNQLN